MNKIIYLFKTIKPILKDTMKYCNTKEFEIKKGHIFYAVCIIIIF